MYEKILPYDGRDMVCIYLKKEKQIKRLPRSRSVDARSIMKDKVLQIYGENSLAIKEKSIEK